MCHGYYCGYTNLPALLSGNLEVRVAWSASCFVLHRDKGTGCFWVSPQGVFEGVKPDSNKVLSDGRFDSVGRQWGPFTTSPFSQDFFESEPLELSIVVQQPLCRRKDVVLETLTHALLCLLVIWIIVTRATCDPLL